MSVDKRSYVASRVFSPYRELPWGTGFDLEDKDGKKFFARLVPEQAIFYQEFPEQVFYSLRIPENGDIWETCFLVKDTVVQTRQTGDKETWYYPGKVISPAEFDKDYSVLAVDTSMANRVLSDGETDYVLSISQSDLLYRIYNLDFKLEISKMQVMMCPEFGKLVKPNTEGIRSHRFNSSALDPLWLYSINKAKKEGSLI